MSRDQSYQEDSRDDVIMRDTFRPAIDWSLQDVFRFLVWMGAPINPVYQVGIKRVAYAGCTYASPKEFEKMGEHHPEHLAEWVKTEEYIGHSWKKSTSMRSIYIRLLKQSRLGIHRFNLEC